jgi:N-acetylglucosamine kinase-like BadF-type ATPase
VATILALEGGGSRSQAVLLDESGRVCASAVSRDVNTNFTAFTQAQEAVQQAVSRVLAEAGVPGERVDWLVSALVGPNFGAETFGQLCPRAAYRYYSESQVVFARGGFYHPHGVGVVAATGATAWAVRSDDGRRAFFGGWGALLGDEGSAHALGLAALRASTRAYEGRLDAATGLVAAIAAHFDLTLADYRAGLVRVAYSGPLSRAEIAALAPLVTELAGQGDVIAQRLVAKTAADLAWLGLHTARALFTAQESFPVVLAGGLVNAGEMIFGPLRAGLAVQFPLAQLVIGFADPAVALARLAQVDLNQEEG